MSIELYTCWNEHASLELNKGHRDLKQDLGVTKTVRSRTTNHSCRLTGDFLRDCNALQTFPHWVTRDRAGCSPGYALSVHNIVIKQNATVFTAWATQPIYKIIIIKNSQPKKNHLSLGMPFKYNLKTWLKSVHGLPIYYNLKV